MNDTKKTEAQKQLIKFRERFHKLLMRHPDIRIGSNQDGDPIAWIRTGDAYRSYEQTYLPTSSKQEKLLTNYLC
jgi:hypothetical protein